MLRNCFKLLIQHSKCPVPLVQDRKQPLPQHIKVLLKPDLLGVRISFVNGLHTCIIACQCQVKMRQSPSCIARSDTQSMYLGNMCTRQTKYTNTATCLVKHTHVIKDHGNTTRKSALQRNYSPAASPSPGFWHHASPDTANNTRHACCYTLP